MPTCVEKEMINDCVHECFISRNWNEVKCFLRTKRSLLIPKKREKKTFESLIPFYWHPW